MDAVDPDPVGSEVAGVVAVPVLASTCTASNAAPMPMIKPTKDSVDLGIVTKTPDPDDRRASILLPTAEGRRVVAAHARRRGATVRPAIQDWPQRDRDEFLRLTRKYVAGVEAVELPVVATLGSFRTPELYSKVGGIQKLMPSWNMTLLISVPSAFSFAWDAVAFIIGLRSVGSNLSTMM